MVTIIKAGNGGGRLGSSSEGDKAWLDLSRFDGILFHMMNGFIHMTCV